MSRFPFEKVQMEMAKNNHKWVCGEDMKVPSVDSIKKECLRLLNNANLNGGSCRGAFNAQWIDWGKISLSKKKILDLYFHPEYMPYTSVEVECD